MLPKPLLMKILLLLLITANTLFACFIPPAEDVLLFRRDALKLDENRQVLLSKDLIALANRPTALADSAQRRASAQLIALAANLAPKSKAPLNTVKKLSDSSDEALFSEKDFEETYANIGRTILYLLEDPKRKEHFAVAQLLLDPLATVAPDLGILSARPSTDESARWQRAVAPIANFVTPPPSPPEIEKPEPTSEEMAATEETNLPPEPTEEAFKKVANFSGTALVPVFLQNIKAKTGPVPPRIEILNFEGALKESSGSIHLPRFPSDSTRDATKHRLEASLRRNYSPGIADGFQGRFRLDKNDHVYSNRNGKILDLPMMILAEGLLSERQPVKNLVILGELQEDGSIQSPKLPWQFFEILLAANRSLPGRLLIAPGSKPLLLSLLSQQKEDFFFNFDVFEVATLDEALELSFENAAPKNTVEALAKFQEIRSVGASKSTSVFVSNPHVLIRLAEVEKLEPRLLSASLLKIRGSNDHPQNHSTEALAAIIQSSLVSTASIPYSPPRDLVSSSLEKIHEECRAGLDPLGRHVALADREMYDNALDLANRVRTLARAKERYDKEASSEGDSFHQSLFFNTYKAIQEEYFLLASETAKILGQPRPTDPRLPKKE